MVASNTITCRDDLSCLLPSQMADHKRACAANPAEENSQGDSQDIEPALNAVRDGLIGGEESEDAKGGVEVEDDCRDGPHVDPLTDKKPR